MSMEVRRMVRESLDDATLRWDINIRDHKTCWFLEIWEAKRKVISLKGIDVRPQHKYPLETAFRRQLNLRKPHFERAQPASQVQTPEVDQPRLCQKLEIWRPLLFDALSLISVINLLFFLFSFFLSKDRRGVLNKNKIHTATYATQYCGSKALRAKIEPNRHSLRGLLSN